MPTNVYGENNMVTGKTILSKNFSKLICVLHKLPGYKDVCLCNPSLRKIHHKKFHNRFKHL